MNGDNSRTFSLEEESRLITNIAGATRDVPRETSCADRAWLTFARARRSSTESYCVDRAEGPPFADRGFDYTISVTALCFIAAQRSALRETRTSLRERYPRRRSTRRRVPLVSDQRPPD